MSTVSAVDVLDLRLPLSIKEIGVNEGVGTSPKDLSVHRRSYIAKPARTWEITIPAENIVARDRALSLHNSSGFGALPLRWTPPNETEIEISLKVPKGLETIRTSPQHHSIKLIVSESK